MAGATLFQTYPTLSTLRPTALSRQYGINVEPSYRSWRWSGGPNPDSWWDPAGGQAKVDAEMPLIAQLGVTYVRLEFPWTFLEPSTPGVYDWSRADYIVNSANRNGIQIQPVIGFCPSWAGPANCVPTAGPDGAFVSALVGRYHTSIHYWEMWNESADPKYFNGSEQQYVQNVLVPGYNAVKAADPNGRVIVSGQYNTSQAWVDGLYAAGAKFDIAAYHDYSGGSAASANGSATAIQGWFAGHGFAGPLWLGEFGVQENSLTDTNQQSYFTGVIQSSNPSAVIMWYSLRDDDIYTGATTLDHHEYYGLAQHDLTLKQGFCAYHALVATGACLSPSPSLNPSPTGSLPPPSAVALGTGTASSTPTSSIAASVVASSPPAPSPSAAASTNASATPGAALNGSSAAAGRPPGGVDERSWLMWVLPLLALIAALAALVLLAVVRRTGPRSSRAVIPADAVDGTAPAESGSHEVNVPAAQPDRAPLGDSPPDGW